MNLIIRPAKKCDLATCERLLNLPELFFPDGKPWSKDWIVNYINENFFLVAEKNDKVVGCIIGEQLKNNGSLIWLLSIDSNYRDSGIGRQLLEAYETAARNKGLSWIMLYSVLYDERTLRFYQKNGYLCGSKLTECLKYL